MRRTPLILTTAAWVLAFSAPAHAEPFKDMLNGLLADHPQIKVAKEGIAASEATKQEAFSGYLPKLDLSGSSGFESVDRTGYSPPGVKTNLPTDNYGLTLTQNLFNGWNTTAQHATAEKGVEIATITLTQTQQQILFEGATAYIEVLRQIELTNLAVENEETLKKQLHLEDERVQRGSGIAVDVLQAKSRLQISKERHTAFMGALKDAISRYIQVFGKLPEVDSMTIPALPIANVPATLDEAIAIATSENPTLISTGENVEVAALARKTAHSGFYPSVDIVGASTYNDNLSGTSGEETNYSVALRTTWQLYSGFADRARTRRAAHNYQSALESSEYVKRKIVEEVKLAWSSLNTNKSRYDLLQNAVNIAGEVYDARKRLRDAGSDTALNVLDAENELFRAKIDAESARYDYYNAIYRLLLSMGRLNMETI